MDYHNPRPESSVITEMYASEYFGGAESFSITTKLERYKEGKEDYITKYKRFEPLYTKNLTSVLKNIERYINRGKLLDVGCAAGFLLNVARKRGWEVYGVEPSDRMCRYGKEVLGIEMINGTLNDADFKNNHFDVVNLTSVLEHVTHPLELVKEAYRISKRKMILRIQVPNELYNSTAKVSMADHGQPRPTIMPPAHLYFYNGDTIVKLVKKLGLNRYG